MSMMDDEGWIAGARHCPSPNCNARPPHMPVSLVVIHGISLPPGQFGGMHIDALFCNRLDPEEHPYFAAIAGMKVSAHLLVRRDGEVVQYVPLSKRAWHAGESAYDGRGNCNDFSVGIELEGTDDTPYDPRQYPVLAGLIRQLRAHFPAIGDRIAGHEHIAPGRKTDPGPSFDWELLRRLLDDQEKPGHV